MTILPQEITSKFYKTIRGDISIDDFEQWLYMDEDLEKLLRPDDYLDLISLNFKKSGAKYELWDLLKKHIDLKEFEKYKMLELLREAKQKTSRQPDALIEIYDLCYKGYDFLQELAWEYGLLIVCPNFNNTPETWEELTESQQKEIIDSFSPRLAKDIDKVIEWIETEKIILMGEQNKIACYYYEDLRTERESNFFVISDNNETDLVVDKELLGKQQQVKKWWEFWK
jgi:hypothetical protein